MTTTLINVQQQINNYIKNGSKTNKFGLVQIENTISTKEFLFFSEYLSTIAIEKGSTEGTDNNGLSIVSNWYYIGKGDIELVTYRGIGLRDRREFLKIIYTPVI